MTSNWKSRGHNGFKVSGGPDAFLQLSNLCLEESLPPISRELALWRSLEKESFWPTGSGRRAWSMKDRTDAVNNTTLVRRELTDLLTSHWLPTNVTQSHKGSR